MATDRLSAFDVVLPTPIPDKGRVLTQLSLFWFETLRDIVPNHVLSATEFPDAAQPYQQATGGPFHALPQDASRCPSNAWCVAIWSARAGRTIAPRAKSAALRCRRACANRTGCPRRFSRHRPKPPRATTKIYPSTKWSRCIGGERAEQIRDVSLEIYRRAAAYAEPRGILLADTKFEFGLIGDELIWIDEALTPDSSRFWPAAGYVPGQSTAFL